VLARSPRAEAYEHQWHFGTTLGFSQLSGGPTSAGFGGGVHLAYGINDTFNLMGAFDVTAHPYGQWMILSGGVGAAWIIDTFQWVPYVGAIAGPAGLVSTDPKCGAAISEPCRAFRINLALPFGLDYQLNKKLTIGLGGKLQMLLLGEAPWTTLGAFAKVEYTWGY
jgi:hypothetical protein